MSQIQYPSFPIVIVDDEAQFLQSASFSLRTMGINNIRACQDSREVLPLLEMQEPSVIVLDMLMPYISGKELLPQIISRRPGIPIIVITAVNEVDLAVECMKTGACDYLVKPVDKTRLVTCVKKAIAFSELSAENRSLRQSLLLGKLNEPAMFEDFITCSSAMQAIFQYIEAIARTGLPILVTGETGSGKELIARAIHKASKRSGDFVAVNIAGLDDTLFSDTLFGHEKGAFTGAEAKRPGLIAKASNGTIFLDEIGDLRLESQVKLLRLLDEKMYYPVGSDSPVSTNCRIIVATNRLLDEEQKTGRFRSDLFYRLQSHHIAILPLRNRKEDIPCLVDYFLEKASDEIKTKTPTPPDELYILLSTYHFPGNVRELRGMVYDAVSRHKGGILSMETFKSHLGKAGCAGGVAPLAHQQGQSPKVLFAEQLPTIREIEHLLVDEALRRSKSNQSIAARMLGITRSALNKRINHPREENELGDTFA
jgi:DNA-binding NtrC family response regulator